MNSPTGTLQRTGKQGNIGKLLFYHVQSELMINTDKRISDNTDKRISDNQPTDNQPSILTLPHVSDSTNTLQVIPLLISHIPLEKY